MTTTRVMTTTGTTAAEVETTKPLQIARAGGRSELGAAAARLAELFEEHAPLVLGLCRGLLRDATEAEDAAQQTFLSAYRSLLAGTAPREPAAWLATIARNECRTRARDRMREPLPLFLRDLVRRVLGSGDAASAGTLAKLGSAPVAAKVAASTAGVALVGAGAVSLTPHRHARRTVQHAPSPAARRLETKPSAKPAKLQRPVRHLSRSAVAGAWHRPRHEDAAAAEPEREQGAAPRERESEPRVQEREGGGGGAGPEAAKPEETQTGESGRDATRSAGSGSGETAQESQEGSGSGDSAVGDSSGSGDNSGSSDSADSGTGD